MARPKKRAVAAEAKSTNPFVEALKFLAIVTKDIGVPFETHIYLRNGFATAKTDVLSAGIKIADDLFACPHNSLMINALSKCGQNLSITQLDNFRLSIKSDKFKAFVPCVDPAILQFGMPDDPIGALDNSFKTAIETMGAIPNTNFDERVHLSSILINGPSVIGTNGVVIFEYWHGLNLPTGLGIPKAIIKPLQDVNKKLVGYGYSFNSFTFWFEDNSWLKTQLMAQHWPDVSFIWEGSSNPFPVPADFWEGLAAIAPFSQDGCAYFDKEKLCSHNAEGIGASFDVAGLPAGPVYPIKQLQLLKGLAETIDFIAPSVNNMKCLKFFGKQIRGVVAGRN